MRLQNKLCFEPLKHLKGLIMLIGNFASRIAPNEAMSKCFHLQQTSAGESFAIRNSCWCTSTSSSLCERTSPEHHPTDKYHWLKHQTDSSRSLRITIFTICFMVMGPDVLKF
jgi:hypothetical protein